MALSILESPEIIPAKQPKGAHFMRMRYLSAALALSLITLCSAPPAQSQAYHWDSGPTGLFGSPTWWDITSDHDEFCDNTSSDMQGFADVDCHHRNDSSSAVVVNADQDCGTGYCTVSATVRCPYLLVNGQSPNPVPYGSMYTFTCTGSAMGSNGGVRAGYLGGGRKGVECGNISCGCERLCPPGGIQWNGSTVPCYHEFFGFPAMVGGNNANYVCQ